MKMDVEGNLYVAGNTVEGIWVFGATGDLMGLIGIGEGPANLAWGGESCSTLFITAKTSVYRLPMRVAGLSVGSSRVRARYLSASVAALMFSRDSFASRSFCFSTRASTIFPSTGMGTVYSTSMVSFVPPL